MLDYYYVRNRHTGVCIGDKEQGKIRAFWNGSRHIFEGTYERAEKFLLQEAWNILSHAPSLWEIVPEFPQTCQWSPEKHKWDDGQKYWT